MRNYEIKKDARDFGCKTNWYNTNNLEAVNAANPTRIVGGRVWPAAYFVQTVERVCDLMRDYNPHYDVRTVVAGPFSCEAIAQEWAEMHLS